MTSNLPLEGEFHETVNREVSTHRFFHELHPARQIALSSFVCCCNEKHPDPGCLNLVSTCIAQLLTCFIGKS